jgi:Ca2+-transporting ATPase
VFVGGAAFSVTRIGGRDWAISIIVGLIAIPLGALIRLLPTAPFARLLIKMKVYPDPNALPQISPAAEYDYEFHDALDRTKNNLDLFRSIRSESRLRASPMVLKSRRRRMKDANIQYPTLLTMAPSLLLGAVAAGQNWLTPIDKLNEKDGAAQEGARPSGPPASGKVAFHPDTDKSDPLYTKYSRYT